MGKCYFDDRSLSGAHCSREVLMMIGTLHAPVVALPKGHMHAALMDLMPGMVQGDCLQFMMIIRTG